MRNVSLIILMMFSATAAAEDIHGYWTSTDSRGRVEYRAVVTDEFDQLKLVSCSEAKGETGSVIACKSPLDRGNLTLKSAGAGSYKISTPGNAFTSITLQGATMKISGPWGFRERVWTRSDLPFFFLPHRS